MPTTFTNQATLSYNNQSIPSNVVTGVLTGVIAKLVMKHLRAMPNMR